VAEPTLELRLSDSGTPDFTVMINFICQLDWATDYPDICLNLIMGVSVRVFSDEINIGYGPNVCAFPRFLYCNPTLLG
jgi:hypothetical protein